jgi:DNA-binding NarL/FixJ family response regulator
VDELTKKEKKVLRLLMCGLQNVEIAKQLEISVHTVKAHIERIYYKLKVKNRVQASVLGFLNGYKDMGLIIKHNPDPSIVEE